MKYKGNELKEEREKMTNNEFLEYVKRKQYQYDLKVIRKEFTENIYIDKLHKGLVGGFHFADCIFQGVAIDGLNFTGNINFSSNCIGKELDIDNCEINEGFAMRASFENVFINETTIENVDIIESRVKDSFHFDTCTINRLTINTSSINALSFTECILNTKCEIKTIENLKNIRFSGGKANNVFLFGFQTNRITFKRTNFHNDCKILGVVISNSLLINDCTFQKGVNFELKEEYLRFIRSLREYDKVLPGKVSIQKSNFGEGFFMSIHSTLKQVKKIEEINIKFSDSLIGNVTLSNLAVDKCVLSGFNNRVNLTLDNIAINNFEIRKFSNYSNIKIYNLSSIDEKISTFKIIESVLGKTNFFNINFKKFSLIIEDSQIGEATFTNVKWPNSIPISEEKKEENYSTEEHKKQETIYRQLKQVMKREGDKPTALKFERLEWLSYKEAVAAESNFNDRLILWSNQSNNYGLSWIKPLLFLLGFTLYFYIMIVCSCFEEYKEEAHYSSIFGYSCIFIDKIYMYFHFLNPAHNLHFFAPEVLKNNVAMFLNVLMRFFNGYFIFQTIRAFRKFIS